MYSAVRNGVPVRHPAQTGMPQEKSNLASASFSTDTALFVAIKMIRREIAAMGPDRERALQLTVDRALSLTGATGAAIALIDGEIMPCVARSGSLAPEPGSKLQIGTGFSGKCIRSGKSLRCDDAQIDDRVDRDSCCALGIRSMIAVPIEQGNRIAGLIEVFSPFAHKFKGTDEIVLEELAEVVSAVLAAPRSALSSDNRSGPQRDAAGSKWEAPAGKDVEFTLLAGVADNSEFSKKLIRAAIVILLVAVAVSTLGVALWRVLPGIRHLGDSTTLSPSQGLSPEPGTVGRSALSIPRYANDLAAVRAMAEQGNAAAQFALGARYAIGEDVTQDYGEAVRWFTKAAEQGHPMAESILSAYYWQGRGVPKDLTKAYFWLLVAQAGGDQVGKERVAFLASQMAPSQLAAAKAQADQWLREHKVNAAR
jgi:GAF domain/Sel1 repeat